MVNLTVKHGNQFSGRGESLRVRTNTANNTETELDELSYEQTDKQISNKISQMTQQRCQK